jgi:chloride channel 7
MEIEKPEDGDIATTGKDTVTPSSATESISPRWSDRISLDRALSGLSDSFHSAVGGMTPHFHAEDAYPWILVLLTAGLIGIVEYLPAAALAWSLDAKFSLLDSIVEDYGVNAMIWTNIGIAVGCVVVSCLIVLLLSPVAAGSGIPPIIAYLANGKLVNKALFSPLTVFVKMVGVVLAITGGLAIGREGPAIHIGAAIGDICNKVVNNVYYWYTGTKVKFDGFIKSNVVMFGCAAGFSSAFRSPVGGMLYTVEEVATHWDIKEHMMVGGQMFFTAAFAGFVTQAITRVTSESSDISFASIIIFDGDEAALNTGVIYHYEDIIGFLLVAVLCGWVGGVYTNAAVAIKAWRTKNVTAIWQKVLDGAIVAFVTACVFSCIPMMMPDCHHDPADDDHRRRLAGAGARRYVQYDCDDYYYNDLASLSLAGEEGVIRHLLSRDDTEFELKYLAVFLVFYVPLTLSVMGLAVPCGTFVPNLLLGSLLGRIVGEIAQLVFPNDLISTPGVYALIGAGSQLGAWTRTMMAVVVTLIEITGDVGLTIPIIITVVIARSVSNSVAHHSYTHALFYELVDDPDSDEPLMLHPNDWVKSATKPGKAPDVTSRQYRKNSKHSIFQNMAETADDDNELDFGLVVVTGESTKLRSGSKTGDDFVVISDVDQT